MKSGKINIAFLIDTFSCDTAGTQKQLIETIRRLNRDIFEPLIICLHSSPWMENNELPCPVTVLGYRGFLKINFLHIVLKLSQIISRQSIHILQTFFEDAIFVAFLATFGMTSSRCVLLSSRRDMGLGASNPWYHRLYPLMLPFVSRHFDGIITNGQEIKKWVAKRESVPLAKIHVVHNGTALPIVADSTPELFNHSLSGLWIGMVASLTPVKRVDVFLRALGIVAATRLDIQFQAVVLGDGPEREALLALAHDCCIIHRVHFLGAVREVSPFLQRVDVGVLCSDREGFSNAVLEYMAHALPVVVTEVGGNKELVESTTGLCVPAGDFEALAAALIELADDSMLRERLGRTGQAKVKSLYSWDRSMAELEEYYTQQLSVKGIQV